MTGFWCFMLAMELLIPLAMLLVGRRFCKSPPSRVNGLYGYRTPRSMKNQDTWAFAHRRCGRLWMRLGGVLLPATALASLVSLVRPDSFTGWYGGALVGAQCAVMALSILPVERALKRAFDENGNWREQAAPQKQHLPPGQERGDAYDKQEPPGQGDQL